MTREIDERLTRKSFGRYLRIPFSSVMIATINSTLIPKVKKSVILWLTLTSMSMLFDEKLNTNADTIWSTDLPYKADQRRDTCPSF